MGLKLTETLDTPNGLIHFRKQGLRSAAGITNDKFGVKLNSADIFLGIVQQIQQHLSGHSAHFLQRLVHRRQYGVNMRRLRKVVKP